MSRKTELKLKIKNSASLEQRLQHLGAKFQKTKVEFDTYFRQAGSNTNEVRVRRVVENNGEFYGFFGYVSPISEEENTINQNIETKVENPDEVVVILESLGYESTCKIMRTRKHYLLGTLRVGVDYVPGVGDFVKIGGDCEQITGLARKLGLNPKETISKSYSELRDAL